MPWPVPYLFSLSLSLSRAANINVGGWIPSAIKRLTRISELPKHWPKIICTPEPGILLLFLSAVDIPNAKLFRPRLFTRSQLGAEPTHPPLHLLPRIPCNPILTNALLAITTSLTSTIPWSRDKRRICR